MRGELQPRVAGSGSCVEFLNGQGSAALTYGGLKAWDADGKAVEVRFVESTTEDKGLALLVDDTAAKYPITVDPIAQQALLIASNAEQGDRFGEAVAISGDTVVVGAWFEDSNARGVDGNQSDNSRTESGAAYVFVRDGDSWTQQAYLKGTGAFWEHFGFSVDISGDIIVIGAPGFNGTGYGGNDNAGGAFVFVREGTTWSTQALLTASNLEGGDQFGNCVAINGDTIVVGAPQEDSNAVGVNGVQANNSASGSGAAYVFVGSSGSWIQQAYLKASNTDVADSFGVSVAIYGNTIIVGADGEDSISSGVNGPQNDGSSPASGAAYVFTRTGTGWGQQAYLKASNTGAGDGFGTSVDIDGNSIVVGAYGEGSNSTGVDGDQGDDSAAASGAAYVFVRDGVGWQQQAYLKASNTESGDWFGLSVSISGDRLIVGAAGESSNATGVDGDQLDNSALRAGAAYLFERDATGVWGHTSYLKGAFSGPEYRFGASVALDGDTQIIGAQWDSLGTAQNKGAAYVYLRKYRLIAVSEHGTVSGEGDYQRNSVAELAASPSPGYLFGHWTGDATGTDNPLTVLMDSDKTVTAVFGPDTNDDDDDGLTNYQEIVEVGSNPTIPDTDGDQVKDGDDAFPLDIAEWLDTDGDGIGDNADLDDDGDGISDEDEINIHGTNPKRADSDGDGLNDYAEIFIHGTNPNLADTDNDGLSDGAEVNTHGTLPKVADTDGDGFLDGYEVYTGKSPLNDQDKPALVAEARTAIEFTFPSALGKTYRIEDSLDLATWTTVESGIPGNGQVIQRFYSTRNMPQRFFRVEEDGP